MAQFSLAKKDAMLRAAFALNDVRRLVIEYEPVIIEAWYELVDGRVISVPPGVVVAPV